MIERLSSGMGIGYLALGLVILTYGLGWNQWAFTGMGLVGTAFGIGLTIRDAKERTHWPWKGKGF